MYISILKGLIHQRGYTKSELITLLQDLKPYVVGLREGYLKPQITVDYRDQKTQLAYLISYFPHYSQILVSILSRFNNFPFFKNVKIFGGGPCPEIVGYLEYVTNKHTKHIKDQINFTVYDIYAEEWAYKRNFVLKYICNKFHFKISHYYEKLDISQKNIIDNIIFSEEATLIVFQNCLNEILLEEHQNVIDNMEDIINKAPKNSILIIAEVQNNSSLNLIKKIRKEISSRIEVRIYPSDPTYGFASQNIYSKYSSPHKAITEHLLTNENKLKPKKYINFNYLLLQKR